METSSGSIRSNNARPASGPFASAAAALQEFVTRVPNHVPALMRLVEICVDGGLEATMYSAQALLADAYIAGYSVINDYTMRDYQYRTLQWDQGKTFDKTSGFGPFLDTDYTLGTKIETRLEGEVMQSASTDDLVFTPAKLVDYISHIVTLQPGDVIITGTTGGVGAYRTPPLWMKPGDVVEVDIEGIGVLRNQIAAA